MNFLIRGREYLEKFKGFKLVGRDTELQSLISILLRGGSNSVIVYGPGGSGCSAICLGIQEAKMKPDAPFDLVSKRLFWLDTNSLFASGNSETINNSFRRILGRLRDTIEPVLILDDTKDFTDACRNNGTTHFINALLGLVREKKCQIIIEVKEEDLESTSKSHSDIKELFTTFLIEEPSGPSLQNIVEKSTDILSEYHRIKVSDTAITTAIKLTTSLRGRYDGLDRAQPDLSITLIDRALASYRLSAHKSPTGFTIEEWTALKKQLDSLYANQRDGESVISELEDRNSEISARHSFDPISKPLSPLSEIQSPEIEANLTKIRNIKGIIEADRIKYLSVIDIINSKLLLTDDLVIAEFSNITGIPVSKLNRNESEKLVGLEESLKTRIFGQNPVIHKVSNGIKIGKIGRRNPDKPLASYLFLGPSGCGKTELAKAISWIILDDERALTRFDMSEYMEKHSVARLIGAPPGYEGFESGGILINLVRKNPKRILLFDEIEKAHPDIFNVFLQILDAGRLTDGLGRTAYFSDSIIVMTTNIGQSHFLNDASAEEANAAAMVELSETYRSEFLNRFNGRENIICFEKLEIDSIKKIAQREINSINTAYADRDISVFMDGPNLTKLCVDKYDVSIGARGLPGYISTNLENVIVDYILSNNNDKVKIDVTYNVAQHKLDMEFVHG
jgi:ATP-dependent Clp protease ATP-binding subunit ClpB